MLSFMLMLFVAFIAADFQDCTTAETAAINECMGGCDPAVSASSNSNLKEGGCPSLKCFIYCVYHTDDISQKCITGSSVECVEDVATEDKFSGCDVACGGGASLVASSLAIVAALFASFFF